MRWLIACSVLLALLLVGPATLLAGGRVELGGKWYEADRSPTGLAPDPGAHPGAVVQVYAARAFDWRGVFAVHTWIATKKPGADRYRSYQVTRWDPAPLPAGHAAPDRHWFGSRPVLLADLRGEAAAALVGRIAAAAADYPLAGDYRTWPGPNSNTFTAWVLRRVPGLDVELPPTAIGKDYLHDAWLAPAPSATGYQVSAGGLVGVTLARAEGLELNLFGAVLGLDPGDLALKLPGLGRVGPGADLPTG